MSDRETGTSERDERGDRPEPSPTGPEADPTDRKAGDGSGSTADEPGGRFGSNAPVTYLTWAAVAVLAVTALVALFGFYTGVSRVISVWVSRPYRPVVNATFNLALLLAALGGIGLLLRGRD